MVAEGAHPPFGAALSASPEKAGHALMPSAALLMEQLFPQGEEPLLVVWYGSRTGNDIDLFCVNEKDVMPESGTIWRSREHARPQLPDESLS